MARPSIVITADVSPHHLYFYSETIMNGATVIKSNPPVRNKEHQERLAARLFRNTGGQQDRRRDFMRRGGAAGSGSGTGPGTSGDCAELSALRLVASAHLCCHPDLKMPSTGDMIRSLGGVSSILTALSSTWTIARTQNAPIHDVARCMSVEPAKLLGLEGSKGVIRVGNDADLVVFDPDKDFEAPDHLSPLVWAVRRDSRREARVLRRCADS